MENKKIACLIINISNKEHKNFQKDKFFSPNAVNSFTKWHPDVDMHFITNDNLQEYLTELNITEYYDNLGLVRIHLIKELIKVKGYTKVIMLGADTFTCSRLDEFIEDNTTDIICSSGPPYSFMKTQYWQPQVKTFQVEVGGPLVQDVSFINADVTCFNGLKGVETIYNTSIEYWTDHAEQGGMNYCYINQDKLDVSVKIVDFPYIKAKSLYNVRSKGIACGGNQMINGKLWNGHFQDPNSSIIGDTYPTFTYYIKDNKLYTSDHKQIKVFHYAEALGVKSKEEYNETLNEIKTRWFNPETIEFLTNKCNCNFS
tara:strand:- start:193 stop:1134 length:942 start_codon:yes stop_codon:yes gene_type:complete